MEVDYVMVSEIPFSSQLMFYSSILVMISYMSRFFFLNLRKKQKNIIESNTAMDDYDCQKLAAKGKKMGYKILINSMVEYHQQFTDQDFENFLRIYWNKDYDIYLKNKQGDSSCKRDYSDWRYLFKLTFKRLKSTQEWILMN